MVNSSARQGYESTCRIEKLKDRNLRLAFSTKLAGLFEKAEGSTYRVRPGLIDSPQNFAALEAKCWLMHNDILNGQFDPSLEKYGIKTTKQKIAFLETPVRESTILEIWDNYVTFVENRLSLNTLLKLKKHWRNALIETTERVGNNHLAIRKYLTENKPFKVALEVLRTLERSHNEGIRQGLCKSNPFDGMTSEFNAQKRKNKLDDDHEISDEEISNIELAFSVDEMNLIISSFHETFSDNVAQFLEFLFLTGTRLSEAIAVKWTDVKWDKECIVFSRQWIDHAECFAPLKGTKKLPDRKQYRVFPMPKNGRLWKLIESIDKVENRLDLIFVNSRGKPFRRNRIWEYWSGHPRIKKYGVVKKLIESGQVSRYLSPHHTRHTFNCIQQNIYGIDSKVVSSWIGHHPEINEKHYWEVDKRIKPGYGDNEELHNEQSEIELLREQNKLLQQQLEEMKKMIEQLNK